MKRKTTKEYLVESFLELAEHKPVNKITVASIVENCGLTQPTFYRYFKDKYDLITWAYLDGASRYVKKVGAEGYTWRDAILDGVRYFIQYRSFLLNAFLNTSGMDSLLSHLIDLNSRLVLSEVGRILGDDPLPENLPALTRIYCLGTVHYMQEWLLQTPGTAEEAAELIEEACPLALKRYLYP